MIEKAIEKIKQMTIDAADPYRIGEHYFHRAGARLTRIEPPEHTAPSTINFHTLDGMVDYIQNDHDGLNPDVGCALHVASHNTVYLIEAADPANYNKRFCYAGSVFEFTPFQFGNYFELETFVIQLQGMFIQDGVTALIIDMLGSLANERIVTQTDCGFQQSLQIKTGITTAERVTVENPVSLMPYRTFPEVSQPVSNCLLRFKDGQDKGVLCALFEADGGLWRTAAIKNIKEWFRAQIGFGLMCEMKIFG